STGVTSAYKVGDRVFHQKFGNGNVVRVEGNKLTIAFDKAGEQHVGDRFVERGGGPEKSKRSSHLREKRAAPGPLSPLKRLLRRCHSLRRRRAPFHPEAYAAVLNAPRHTPVRASALRDHAYAHRPKYDQSHERRNDVEDCCHVEHRMPAAGRR